MPIQFTMVAPSLSPIKGPMLSDFKKSKVPYKPLMASKDLNKMFAGKKVIMGSSVKK